MTTQAVEWWYADGSEQRGPVSLEEMRTLVSDGRLDRDTLVWHAGMSGWTPAGMVSELGFRPKLPSTPSTTMSAGMGSENDADFGDRSSRPSASDAGSGGDPDSFLGPDPGPYRGTTSTAGYNYGAMPGAAPVKNNMVLAIVSTVLCCLPLGIVSIVKASQVKAIAESGDITRAQSVANDAKKWALWSIALGMLAQILYFALVGGSALLGFMESGGDF